MGVSLSTDLILGVLLGTLGTLLFQQLTRATGSVGRFLPLLFFLLFVGCIAVTVLWLQG